MARPLSNRDIGLPVFVPNQILRARDLNNLVKAIDKQIREARVYNVGAGILRGLVAEITNVDAHKGIAVTAGAGNSSDGYLFEMNACTLTHRKKREVSKNAFRCNSAGERGSCDDKENLFEATVWELEEFNESDQVAEEWDRIPTNIEDSFYTKHCLVLLWCEKTTERRSCFNECEAKGADQFVEILRLMVPTDELTDIMDAARGGNNNEEPGEDVQVELEGNPYLERFGFKLLSGPGPDGETGTDDDYKVDSICAIDTWEKFFRQYLEIAQDALVDLQAAYDDAVIKFGVPFSLGDLGDFNQSVRERNLQAYLDGQANPNCVNIQYFYAYLRDLIKAYFEFKCWADGLPIPTTSNDTEENNLTNCLFPGYLSLGLVGAGTTDNPCRTQRFLPVNLPLNTEKEEKAVCYYKRMQSMVKEVRKPIRDIAQKSRLIISPSCKIKKSLEGRALPFYYKEAVFDHWSCKYLAHQIPGYWQIRRAAPLDEFLKYEYEDYNFYRIEGHFGRKFNLGIGLAELVDERKKLNIPFDIKYLRLGPGKELDISREGELELHFGQVNEVYQNTRNDILCKLEELDNKISETALGPFSELLENSTSIAAIDSTDEFIELLDTTIRSGALEQSIQSTLTNAKSIFDRLFKQYNQLWEDIERETSFHDFAKSHPGMEHLGGVPQGGTFILVYVHTIEPFFREQLEGYAIGQQWEDEAQVIAMSDEALIDLALMHKSEKIPNDPLFSGTILDLLKRNTTRKIVADFCLPYLCCSSAPVIRNEISQIVPRFIIDQTEWCIDADNITENPTIGVSPEGGFLSIKVGNDNIFTERTVEGPQTPSFDGLTFAEYGKNGVITVELLYTLGGAVQEQILRYYKKPNFACNLVPGEGFVEDDCVPKGRPYTIEFNPPVPLNEVQELQVTLDGILIYDPSVHQGDDIPAGVMIDEATGTLVKYEASLLFGPHSFIVIAKNGNDCPNVCDEKFVVECPKTEEIEQIEKINFVQIDSGAWQASEPEIIDPQADGNIFHLVSSDQNDPGFFAFRFDPTGGEVKAEEGGTVLVKNLVILVEDGEQFECSNRLLYFIIYNKGQALDILDSAARTNPILNDLRLKLLDPKVEIDQFIQDINNPGSIDFKYVFEACSPEIAIADFTVELTTAKIDIQGRQFCYDGVSADLNPEFEVFPLGGKLTASINGGNERDIEITEGRQILEINTGLITPADEFTDGKLNLELKYLVNGITVPGIVLEVFKKPEFKVIPVLGDFGYDPDCNLDKQQLQLKIDPPIPVNEVTELYLSIGDRDRIAIKSSSGVNEAFLDSNGRFAGLDSGSINIGSSSVLVEAVNGPCSLPLNEPIDACPNEVEITKVEFTVLNEELILSDTAFEPPLNHAVLPASPGFFALKLTPTTGSIQTQLVIDDIPVPGVFGIKKEDTSINNCVDKFLYYIIYDVDATKEFITNDAILDQISLKVEDLADTPPVNFDQSAELIQMNIEYSFPSTNCTAIKFEIFLEILQDRPGGGDDDDPIPTPPETPPFVVEEVDDRSIKSAAKSPPDEKATQLLNERRSSYIANLQQIGAADKSLTSLKSYKLANAFLPFFNQDAAALNTRYEEVLDALLRSSRSAKEKRKAQLEKVLRLTTYSYLDKLLFVGVGQATSDFVHRQMQLLKKGGINLTALKRGWKAAALKKGMDKRDIDLLNKLIK